MDFEAMGTGRGGSGPRERLAAFAAAARGTRYRLDSIGVLGDAICLFPGDDQPLMQWRERLITAVGRADAVDPSWRLHLTICRNQSRDSLEAVRKAIDHVLPLSCEVRDVCVPRLVEPDLVSMENI